MSKTSQTFPDIIKAGNDFILGSYTFTPDDIIRYAKKFDPQNFHIDAVKAENSLFGALCASGWHTISVWMKLQRKYTEQQNIKFKEAGIAIPEFGPSPGIKNIKWPRPVFAHDVITYSNHIEEIRETKSRPGWSIMSQTCQGKNQNDELVLSFYSSAFIRP